MIRIRKSQDRGHANHGWLEAKHSFSFADYYDPIYMGYSVLRVINQDIIDAGMGFPTHAHKDMEIITYIVDGALEHKDSMGNSAVMKPGEIQKMSAGSGVTHSEFNHLKDQKTQLLQIWIVPDKKGYEPSYDQINFRTDAKNSNFLLVGSPTKKENAVLIHQDVNLYVGNTQKEDVIDFKSQPGRKAWVQLVKGKLSIEGQTMESGDGAALSQFESLQIKSAEPSEFLMFDLPA